MKGRRKQGMGGSSRSRGNLIRAGHDAVRKTKSLPFKIGQK